MSPIFCGCGKTITPRVEWAGKQIRCSCGQELYVPHQPAEAARPADTRPCPYCAELIRAEAILCRFCDHRLDGGAAPGRARSEPVTDEGGLAPLVVGILGWLLCGMLHPVAWIMGSAYESECRSRGVEPSGAGRAGRILGMIGTMLCGIGIVLAVLFALLG